MSRGIATLRLYGAVLWLVVAVLVDAIRESLPSTEDEVGPFVAGMTWAFVLFWAILCAVTWLYAWSLGMRM